MTGLNPDALSTAIESPLGGDERETIVPSGDGFEPNGACSDPRRVEGEASRDKTEPLVKNKKLIFTAFLPSCPLSVMSKKTNMDFASDVSTFAVPCAFGDFFGKRYTVPEKYFYIVLRKMVDQQKSESGWTLLFDVSGPATRSRCESFALHGLSRRVCKSARRKLKEEGLIETRYAHSRKGHRIGTEYRLIDERLARNPKAIHRAILGRSGCESEGVSVLKSEAPRDFLGCAQLGSG